MTCPVRARLVMETDSANAPVAWYVYGLGLLWKVAADDTAYFYHFDGDGNVVAVSNGAKGVVNRYRYDPWGRLVTSDETVENLFRMRGESGWVDDANGLVYNLKRFLYPELRMTLPADGGSLSAGAFLAARVSRRRRLFSGRCRQVRLRRRTAMMRRAGWLLAAAPCVPRGFPQAPRP